jgi:hypothetical protein
VEHPYGTIKRQWGFSYILTKNGICRAGSDVGFIFIAYNLRRIVNIITPGVLKEYLKILYSMFLEIFDLSGLICLISVRPEAVKMKSPSKNHLWLKTA